MTITELAAELIENADQLNGQPLTPQEALVRKIAKIADADGITCQGVNVSKDERFTYEERTIVGPGTFEQAERFRNEQTNRTMQKVKNHARLPLIPEKRIDGYYLDASKETPDVPEWGPYDTKREAEEARRSYLRSNPKSPGQAPENIKRSVSKLPVEPQSEPTQDDPGHTPATTEATTSESEEPVSTSKKKKAKASKAPAKKKAAKAPAAHKANDKPAKAPKAAKTPKEAKPKKEANPKAPKAEGEGRYGALEAAYDVLKGRTKPMTPKELIAAMTEKGLWTSPGGKTPDATLSAAMNREIAKKGKDSRFCKPEPGHFAANS